MTLGFSVDALLPRARGDGQLRMGLVRLTEGEWLQPDPDLAARAAAFDEWPDAVQLSPQAEEPGREDDRCGVGAYANALIGYAKRRERN